MKSTKPALPATGRYIVAVSGGVDSVALLHMLVNQAPALSLRVAHVNHGLRPNADSDERFVRELAKGYDLPFDSIRLELGQASEAQARLKRYQFLFDLLKKYRANAIITAHHSDDRLETSLFNTLRGSGPRGQAAAFDRRRVIRPLIDFRKADLIEYASARGLPWREDQTNQDLAISRNFIRHELAGSHDELHRALIDRQQELAELVEGRLKKLYYQFLVGDGLEIPRAWAAEASWPLMAAFVHYCLCQLAAGHHFDRPVIEEVVRFSKTGQAGSWLRLSDSLIVEVKYDTVAVVFLAPNRSPLPLVELVPQTSLDYGRFRLSFGFYYDNGADFVRLPPGRYQVRTSRPGDSIKTAAGTKKIQDIFVDRKIARSQRGEWPIVTAADNSIIWLPGLATSLMLAEADQSGYYLMAEEV